MKKYILFTSFIGGMGGGQMYVRNKVLYLRTMGWDVDVFFSVISKDINIPELKEFKDNCILPSFPIHYYASKKRKKVINKLVDHLVDNNSEEIVIESNKIGLGLWAEAIAGIIGAKHISYPLDEKIEIKNTGLQQYLVFKHERRELIGIQETSLFQMFASFHPITKEMSYFLPASCTNVIADIDSPFLYKIESSKYDSIVGCLSRLNKGFVMSAIVDFCNYVQQHKDKKYMLILMGDSGDGGTVVNKIQERLNEIKENVEVIITGYLYPVPIRLLTLCDVFFTSAGSSNVCKRSGVPTIVYDANDNKPIGVLGRTTQNSLFRGPNEPPQDFAKLMDQVLVKKLYGKLQPSYTEGLPDMKAHLEFLNQSANNKEYYDISSIHVETKEEQTHYWGIMLLGEKLYKKVLSKMSKLLNFIQKNKHIVKKS